MGKVNILHLFIVLHYMYVSFWSYGFYLVDDTHLAYAGDNVGNTESDALLFSSRGAQNASDWLTNRKGPWEGERREAVSSFPPFLARELDHVEIMI